MRLLKNCLTASLITISLLAISVYPQMNKGLRAEKQSKAEQTTSSAGGSDHSSDSMSPVHGFQRLVDSTLKFRNNSTVSAFDAPTGGGSLVVTNLNDSGPGSLRQLIADAPSNSSIVFASGVEGTLSLTSGSLVIDKSLNITGPGARRLIIDGSALLEGSVLVVREPEMDPMAREDNSWESPQGPTFEGVVISGLTLLGGLGTSDSQTKSLAGGGLYVNISDGFFYSVLISDCVIRNNTASNGGGIFVRGTQAFYMFNSTVSGNVASDNGGGVFIDKNGESLVISSTISGNLALQNGGGFYRTALNQLVGIGASTIAGNFAGTSGGGVYTVFTPPLAEIPSGTPPEIGVVLLLSTIIAKNQVIEADITEGPSVADYPDVDGAFNSAFSLVGIADGSTGIINGVDGNIAGTFLEPVDPLLGPLANNGGQTDTMALFATSPAIDAGLLVFESPFDQRGAPRPWYPGSPTDPPPGPGLDGSDIGAYEFFITTAAPISIGGRISDEVGTALQKARVSVTDSETGLVVSVYTNQFGNYSLENLVAGRTYIVSVGTKSSDERPVQVIYAGDSLRDLNFVLRRKGR